MGAAFIDSTPPVCEKAAIELRRFWLKRESGRNTTETKMKKLLYSSAVLIASCGMAAAQVSVGGAARVGIQYTDADGPGKGMSIFHDVDLTLALSGQTDGGLSFGAEMTIANDQGVSVALDNTIGGGAGNGTSTTAMDSDTNTHTGMFYSTSGRTYLDSMGMPVYTEMTDSTGTVTTKTYHTKVPGSNFMLAAAGTPVTSGSGDTMLTVMDLTASIGTEETASNVLSILSADGSKQMAWTATGDAVGRNGGAIHKWGDRYIVQTDAAVFIVFEMVGEKWQKVDELTEVSNTALAAFEGDNPTDHDNPNVGLLLAEIHRSVSASMPGMAQMQDTMPHEDMVFTNSNTHSVESVKSANITDDSSVYISGGFGKISVGSVDPGDTMASGIADIGFVGIGVDEVAEGLRGKSKRDFLYEFSAGGVSFGLSADANDNNAALGIKYSLDPISVGLGYANEGEGNNVLSIGIGASLGGVSTNVMYSKHKDGRSATGMDASFSAADNMTVTIAAASEKTDMGTKSAYGLGLAFDLGGGATLKTGVGSVKGDTKAELGLGLTF